MSQACALWRGDIGAYIVGALDSDAAARVRRHLRACAACLADYQDLVPVRDWLTLAAEADGTAGGLPPARPALTPIRPSRHFTRWRRLGAACTAAQPRWKAPPPSR